MFIFASLVRAQGMFSSVAGGLDMDLGMGGVSPGEGWMWGMMSGMTFKARCTLRCPYVDGSRREFPLVLTVLLCSRAVKGVVVTQA